MTTKAKRKGAYHHGDLRRGLIEAALRLAKEKGARAISLSEAATLLGVSAAAPYRHFADKEALLAAAAEHAFIEFRTAMRSRRLSTDDVIEGVMRQGEAYVHFGQKHPEQLDLMFSMHFTCLHEGLVSAAAAAFQELLDGVEALVAIGALPRAQVERAAHQLWFLAHGAATIASGTPTPVDPIALLRDGTARLLGLKVK